MTARSIFSLIFSFALFTGACATSGDALEPEAEQALIEAGFSDEAVDDLRFALETEPEMEIVAMGASAANACVAKYKSITPGVQTGISNGRVYASFRTFGFGIGQFFRELFEDTCTDLCGGTVVSSFVAFGGFGPTNAYVHTVCE